MSSEERLGGVHIGTDGNCGLRFVCVSVVGVDWCVTLNGGVLEGRVSWNDRGSWNDAVLGTTVFLGMTVVLGRTRFLEGRGSWKDVLHVQYMNELFPTYSC